MDIKQEAHENNFFACIPKDLCLLILSRLDDLKFLCQCCLVSKHFASTIYHIKTVSITLSSSELPSSESVSNINELFPKISSSTSEEIIRFIQSSSLRGLKFLSFLKNFQELKSISVKFMCPKSVCSTSLINIKVKFSSCGAFVEKLVSLVPTFVCDADEEEYYDDDYATNTYSLPRTRLKHGCFVEWLIVLSLLVKCQPSLERVIITNSNEQGILVLSDEQLVAWRNNLVPGGLLDNLSPGVSYVGWVARLDLPTTGYVMQDVSYLIVKMGYSSYFQDRKIYDYDDDDDEVMAWEYGGEKQLFEEAMNEVSYHLSP